MLLCFSILLHCAGPGPQERGCLGKACKTPHFLGNPVTFYLSLRLACTTGLGGVLQIGINIARIMLFWLRMFNAAVPLPLIWAKMCNIQRKTHTNISMYVRTYIHTRAMHRTVLVYSLLSKTTDCLFLHRWSLLISYLFAQMSLSIALLLRHVSWS